MTPANRVTGFRGVIRRFSTRFEHSLHANRNMKAGNGHEQKSTLPTHSERAHETGADWRERIRLINNALRIRLVRRARTQILRLGQWLLHSRLHSLYLLLSPASQAEDAYAAWIAACEANLPSFEWHQQRSQALAWRPVISVITPVCNPGREWLQAAIESVVAQSYADWQLCICDDASDEPGWLNTRRPRFERSAGSLHPIGPAAWNRGCP